MSGWGSGYQGGSGKGVRVGWERESGVDEVWCQGELERLGVDGSGKGVRVGWGK